MIMIIPEVFLTPAPPWQVFLISHQVDAWVQPLMLAGSSAGAPLSVPGRFLNVCRHAPTCFVVLHFSGVAINMEINVLVHKG